MIRLLGLVVLAGMAALVACDAGEASREPTSTQPGRQPTTTPVGLQLAPTATSQRAMPTPTRQPPTPTPTSQPPAPTSTRPQPTPTSTSVPPSPTPTSEHLTVVEYADVCGELADAAFDLDFEDLAGFYPTLKSALDDLRAVEPPGELLRFHSVLIELMDFNLIAFEDIGLLSLLEDIAALERDRGTLSESEEFERAMELLQRMEEIQVDVARFEARTEEFEVELEAAWGDVSPSTREALLARGCYEDGS